MPILGYFTEKNPTLLRNEKKTLGDKWSMRIYVTQKINRPFRASPIRLRHSRKKGDFRPCQELDEFLQFSTAPITNFLRETLSPPGVLGPPIVHLELGVNLKDYTPSSWRLSLNLFLPHEITIPLNREGLFQIRPLESTRHYGETLWSDQTMKIEKRATIRREVKKILSGAYKEGDKIPLLGHCYLYLKIQSSG